MKTIIAILIISIFVAATQYNHARYISADRYLNDGHGTGELTQQDKDDIDEYYRMLEDTATGMHR